MKRFRNQEIYGTLGMIALLALSGCGVFRKGCKCPPVHRHTQAAAQR